MFDCFVKLLVKNKFSTKILLELDIDILDKIYGYLDEKNNAIPNIDDNYGEKQYFADFIARTKQELISYV